MLVNYEGKTPKLSEKVYIFPGSHLIGDVTIKEKSSVWYNTVIRGDMDSITIGTKTNIQENSSLHVDNGYPMTIKNNVTIGHGAILHGCQIENNCLIGMGATILNGARIGQNTVIAAGALIPENKVIPEGSLVMGVPGKVVRSLTPEKINEIKKSADHYYQVAQKSKND